MRRLLLGALVLAAIPPSSARSAEDFALKDGDRVVFYGDSITEQRLYSVFTELYAVTRFPDRDIRFTHSGWGGDRVTGGGGGPIAKRLARDVVAYKPTVVTIMLGMNDASYRPFDQGIFDTYARGYDKIVSALKVALPDARLTLIRPSPYDDVTRSPNFEGGYNSVLIKYADYVAKLGHDEGATIADLNTGVVDATKKAKEIDPELAKSLNPDRVHPGVSGQLLMAEGLLKAWKAPALVSKVEILIPDVDPATVPGMLRFSPEFENATAAGPNNSIDRSGQVSWGQMDESLPFPIDESDKSVALAMKSSDFVQALDQQIIKVKGLKEANYTLAIDGDAVADFSKEALAEGVNIATLKTPMHAQADRVQALTFKHNEVHHFRWREVQVKLEGQSEERLRKVLDAFDEMEGAIVAEQRLAAQPTPHTFTLTPKK